MGSFSTGANTVKIIDHGYLCGSVFSLNVTPFIELAILL